MNKTTNNFRKCAFCPHHSQSKLCCCKRDTRTISTKSCKNSKLSKKQKKNQTINQSAISYVNNTLPYPSIMAQNSILRTENDYLKKQLQSQFQNVSSFSKEDINTTTLPTSENQSGRNILHEKLYISNRNLQETLMQMDALSKENSEIHEFNKKLQLEIQQLKIQHEEDYEQMKRLKKKNKKYLQMIDTLPTETDVQKIVQLNTQLQGQNTYLREEVDELREKLRSKKTQRDYENLSPEWVAHTSTKINAIEKNLAKLEEENKPENLFMECENENVKVLKNQLILAIKQARIKSKSLHSFSNLQDMLSSSSILSLVQTLCSSMLEPVLQNQILLQKELNRKINAYENKFNKVIKKMQNMTLKVHNNKLRSKSLTRRCL